MTILTWRMSLKGLETKLESEEIGGVVDCFGAGFEEVFSKLTPETVEHEFGGGFVSRAFLEESWSSVMFSLFWPKNPFFLPSSCSRTISTDFSRIKHEMRSSSFISL